MPDEATGSWIGPIMRRYGAVWAARQSRYGAKPERVLSGLRNMTDELEGKEAMNVQDILKSIDDVVGNKKATHSLHRRLDKIEEAITAPTPATDPYEAKAKALIDEEKIVGIVLDILDRRAMTKEG